MSLLKKLMAPFVRGKRERDLDDEMRFHVERQIELYLGVGMTEDEARRRALVEFGGVEQTRETVREQHWTHFVETLLKDLAYSVRMLRKTPGFAAVAVSILALGIGANTAIFTAVNAVLFALWSVPHQEQLMLLREPTPSNRGFLISVPDFEDYRRQQTTFQQFSLWLGQSVNLTGREHPERLIGAYVSDNFFEMLGAGVKMGRTFLPGDDWPGAPPVAIISYEAWQSRLGGVQDLLGSQLILNNEPHTIIGILPAGFSLPISPSDIFIPTRHFQNYKEERRTRAFLVFGRMKDSVTQKQATADLDTIAQRLAREYPSENAGIRAELTGLQELSTEELRKPLLVLLGAVVAVLLIVCANVGNLLLARGTARRHEVEIRAALGASRARLVRQFLCESLLLSLLGGIGGILLAMGLLRILQNISPVEAHLNVSTTLDGRVLFFTLGVSLITGLLFGAAPALQFSRVNLSSTLANASRTSGHHAHNRLRSGFVVCQLAVCLSLLVSAGLLAKSFSSLAATHPGFSPDHLLSMEYRLPPNKYKTNESKWNFHRLMRDQVSRVPGVISASIVEGLPMSGNWGQTSFDLPGAFTKNDVKLTALSNIVTTEYFSTLEIPVLQGRGFQPQDDANGAPVALISQRFAEKYFYGQNPIGQQLRVKDTDETAFASRDHNRVTVIGVVGGARQRKMGEPLEPQIYFSYAQVPANFGTLVVRTAVDPESITEPIRRAIWSVDKDQPVWRVKTMSSLIAHDVAPGRFVMLLMYVFSGLALLLSALGTYAMLSHTVGQRTRELGIRVALGANRAGLLTLVLAQGARLIAAGGLLGMAGSFIASRLLGSLLYQTNPNDAFIFFLGICVMGLVALAACYIPARRATRVDPLVALRHE